MNVRVEICGIDTSTLPILSSKEADDLMLALKGGDEFARRKFIVGNMRLVLSVIKRFSRGKNNVDDIFQVGCVGLIKAIDNFDVSLNVKFSTYAVPMVLGEIKRFLRDSSALKITRSIRDIAYKCMQAKEIIERETGQECTVDALAQKTGIPLCKICNALDAISDPVSIFEPVYNANGDDLLLLDQLKDGNVNDDKWTDNYALKECINALNEKEKQILYLRYYLGKTQTEVSKEVGISQAQVSRLEKCALSKIKKEMYIS